jgi:hypothetical protein
VTSPKQIILNFLETVDDTASWEDIKKAVDCVAQANEPKSLPASEPLYQGKKRTVITTLGIVSVGLVILSVFIVRWSQEWAVGTYAFWVIVPPSWFFIEWVWLFDSKGDAHRLNQFKTTIEIAQKFWAAILVLLALEIFLLYKLKANV